MTKNKEKFLNKTLFYSIEKQNKEIMKEYIDYFSSFSDSNTNILTIINQTRKELESNDWSKLKRSFDIKVNAELKKIFKERYLKSPFVERGSVWELFPQMTGETFNRILLERLNDRSLFLSDFILLNFFLESFSKDFRLLVEEKLNKEKSLKLNDLNINVWKKEYSEMIITNYGTHIDNWEEFNSLWSKLQEFFKQKEEAIDEIIANLKVKADSLQQAKDVALIKDHKDNVWVPSLNEEERKIIIEAQTIREVQRVQSQIFLQRGQKQENAQATELQNTIVTLQSQNAELKKQLGIANTEIKGLNQRVQELQGMLSNGPSSQITNPTSETKENKEITELTELLIQANLANTKANQMVAEAHQQIVGLQEQLVAKEVMPPK